MSERGCRKNGIEKRGLSHFSRGGVTTLIDFAIPYAGDSLEMAADNWMKKAEGKAMIDYTFHICITRWNEHKDQIKGMVDRGFTTFKEFMIYESEGWQSDDRALFGTLEKMKEYGTMLLVHAESARVLDELIARHHTPELMEQYGAQLHAMTRPNFIEAEAIQRVVMWSEVTGGQLYIVHMSTGEGADIIRAAQKRVDRFALHEFQRTAGVGDVVLRDPVANAVADSRLHAPRPRVVAIHANTDDHVAAAFLESVHHARNVGGIVLQIGIERDNVRSFRRAPCRIERRRLSAVFFERQHAQRGMFRALFAENGERAIARAVIDGDDLVAPSFSVECFRDLVEEDRDVLFLVIDREDNR